MLPLFTAIHGMMIFIKISILISKVFAVIRVASDLQVKKLCFVLLAEKVYNSTILYNNLVIIIRKYCVTSSQELIRLKKQEKNLYFGNREHFYWHFITQSDPKPVATYNLKCPKLGS